MSDNNHAIIYENMRKVLEDFFEKSNLLKLQEYQPVKLTQENQSLKEKLDIALKENELLREQVKVLSEPEELNIKENTILSLRAEIKRLQEKHEKENESIQQVLMENANNLKELSSEKANVEMQIKALNSTIKEKERALADLGELHSQEIARLKAEAEEQLKKSEEEKVRISEEWRKKLEELKKPWWKFQ